MQTIIERFYYGAEICDNIKPGKEYQIMESKFDALSGKFEKTLTKEQQDTFGDLVILMFGLVGEGQFDHFSAGFKCGLSLALEAQTFNP